MRTSCSSPGSVCGVAVVMGVSSIMGSGLRGEELGQQALDPAADVVADLADGLDALAGGVGQLPVLVADTGEVRADVAATHGDDDVGGFHGVGGEDFGLVGGDVDAKLLHRLDSDGVDLVGRGGPGGADLDLPLGQGGHEAGGHLGTAGVVDADEHDAGTLGHGGLLQWVGVRRGARVVTLRVRSASASSKASASPAATGSGTDQWMSIGVVSSSWALSHTLMTRSPALSTPSTCWGATRGRSRRWRRATSRASGWIWSAGWVPAEVTGTALARRHSAAARWERAELRVQTNTTRATARWSRGVMWSRAPGTSWT